MKKSFTILEISLVILLISIVLLILSSFYLGIIKALIISDQLQLALENVKSGTEKIFRITKYGWNFELAGNSISFYDRNCNGRFELRLDPIQKNLILTKRDNNGNIIEKGEIFDPQLIKVRNFSISRDNPLTTESYFYFQQAPKIIVYFYDLELNTKQGTSSLVFEQAVAPLNSVQNISLCQ